MSLCGTGPPGNCPAMLLLVVVVEALVVMGRGPMPICALLLGWQMEVG